MLLQTNLRGFAENCRNLAFVARDEVAHNMLLDMAAVSRACGGARRTGPNAYGERSGDLLDIEHPASRQLKDVLARTNGASRQRS
jgi:hypothetical protein